MVVCIDYRCSMKCIWFHNLWVTLWSPKLCVKQSLSLIKVFKMPFYAVARGRAPGIFMNWGDCEAQVKGFPGARYKKFDSVISAQEFISTEGGKSNVSQSKPKTFFNTKPKKSVSTYEPQGNSESIKQPPKSSTKPGSKRKKSYKSESDVSDDDTDIDLILSKQLDDIEKRLKTFEKGVDKIIKNNVPKSQKKALLIEPPLTKRKRNSGSIEFKVDNNGYVEVYTDGACSSNGKNGARAGLGVFWGEGHQLNTSEPVSGRATNNCGEIQAATRAIKLALENGVTKLAIYTDSKFLINSVTKWMPGWKRKGWKLQSGEPVKNEVDFKDLDSVKNKLDVQWNYVEAHKGVFGNEMADQLAKAGAARYNS